ncbi:Phosphodiesterase I [Bertholletia excelsa]
MIPVVAPTLLSVLYLLSLLSPSCSVPSISVSPTTIPRSGDRVTIQWSGVESPSKLDWLGIYSPPNSSSADFIGYLFLSSSPTWQSGSGSLDIPLIDLRSNYEFRIFRWTESEVSLRHKDHDQNPLPGTKHLLAQSGEVGFDPGRGPEQIHLAFTDREDEMRVMFVTRDGKENFVKYGLSENQMDQTAGTQVMRYEREDMCDSPANESVGWRDPGFIHDGVMTNLEKGQRYYYKVGSDLGGWSDVNSFISRNEDLDETVAFLFGDMGTATPYRTFIRTQDESISTMKWILRDIENLGNKPSFVSHIGDISYARGYAWIWDNFFKQIEPVASRVPYHVCIGNHEYDWPAQPWKPDWSYPVYNKDGGGECGVPYSLRFHMPGNSSEPTGTRAPATRNLYYSFDMGAVHFVYISSETNFLPGSSQYDFIKHDLESVNRTKTPFVVVQGHRPMYTSSHEIRDAPLRERMLKHLEPLLVKNKVTLALWGHVHRYERLCPLNNFTCESTAMNSTVHAVIGMAGQDWQPIWEPRPDHPDVPVFPQPIWSIYRGGVFGYSRIVANKEKLTFSYVGNHDGEVHDAVEILASGQVINGFSADDANIKNANAETPTASSEMVGSSLSWYVKGGAVLVLGALGGYILGYLTRGRKETAPGKNWTPVNNQEV